MTTLASSFGYEACCTGSDKTEWLYDLAWLQYEGAVLRDVPLAMESEWKRSRNGKELLADFRKLIVSRAHLRVMVLETNNDKETITAMDQLCDAVRGYTRSLPTDRYLFAVWQNLPAPAVFKFRRFTI